MWNEAKYYSRMARGLWNYCGAPRLTSPRETLRERAENRAEGFLQLAREAVYAQPGCSLLRLLQLAGCEYADLEASVRARGLEPTLRRLCAEGVYVTHDEFKGRAPLVRQGREIPGGEKHFRNPLAVGDVETRSSGSRSGGRGTPTSKTTDFQVHREAHDWLLASEYGLHEAEWVQFRPLLPSNSGLSGAIRAARRDRPMRTWFTAAGRYADTAHYRMATNFMVAVARLRGLPVPFPTRLPENDFAAVARYVHGRHCAVLAFASPSVRIADAAITLGLDLSRITFVSGGEATTDAKRAVITRAGARMVTYYYISEVGPIGFSCAQMSGNDVHVLTENVTVVTRRRPVPFGEGAEVDSLAFTTLLPFAPRFLINTEMDDTGVLETRDSCDCAFGRLGMTTVLRDIRSFGKVTSQGMTLAGADILGILEQALPARFGGAPGDYQLVECERGPQTEVVLRVSPRAIPAGDLTPVSDFLTAQLKRHYGGTLAARMWSHSGGLRAVREEPVTTYTGKVLPLALLGNAENGN